MTHSEPLDKRTRRRNIIVAAVLAAVILTLMGLSVYWVSPEAAEGTESILSGMR